MVLNLSKTLPTTIPSKLVPLSSTAVCAVSHHAAHVAEKTEVSSNKVLTLQGLSRHLVDIEYPIRGLIAERAAEIQKQLEAHPEQFSRFKAITPCNIGNPQLVGRKPITFNRQVLACVLNPKLVEEGNTGVATFPEDVKERARHYLKKIPPVGAYSESRGVALFRNEIAGWFEARDGFKCDPDSILLTDGASSAIFLALELLISKPSSGILIPVPQYPLYSASITRLNGTAVPYYLDEESGWKLTSTELQRAINERGENVECKALVVINPGNPTGSLLTEEDVVDIIRFCEREKLVLIADEVYQDNIYRENAKFVSFRKMAKILNSSVEIVSLHSSSKGFAGECGVRGGLMQLENVDKNVVAVLVKLMTLSLCANTLGQAMLACIMNPPGPGQPSYKLYSEEAEGVYNSLKRRALLTTKKLNEMEGVSCQPIDASMYAFPRITIPPKAIEAANQKGIKPDLLYCIELLDYSGVVCVPGSGFHQKPGTYHFRMTILPNCLDSMLEQLAEFHIQFLKKYSS